MDLLRWLAERFRRGFSEAHALPKPPCYIVQRSRSGRWCGLLELPFVGTFADCQQVLTELERVFGATCSPRLEAGPLSDDLFETVFRKEKGYWDVVIDGAEYLVMRDRGAGLAIFGHEEDETIPRFLEVARHFAATQYQRGWRGWKQVETASTKTPRQTRRTN